MARYGEAEQLLQRLESADDNGRIHAHAFADFLLHAAPYRQGTAARTALMEGDRVLQPLIDMDLGLRLKACQLIILQASQSETDGQSLYGRVVELAAPLTAEPRLAVTALQLVLQALLAQGERRESAVYARCLHGLAARDDAATWLLLAEAAFLQGEYDTSCQRFDQAWIAGGQPSAPQLAKWREASRQSSVAADASSAQAKHGRHLRMAESAVGDCLRLAV